MHMDMGCSFRRLPYRLAEGWLASLIIDSEDTSTIWAASDSTGSKQSGFLFGILVSWALTGIGLHFLYSHTRLLGFELHRTR